MKLRFKHQKFQADAAKAVCDMFAGQPKLEHTYIIDPGLITKPEQIGLDFDASPEEVKRRIEQLNTGHNNAKVLLSADQVLENLQRVQRSNQLPPSPRLEGLYNLTIEMETGARVIIVTGCINGLESRVSGTFINNNSCIA